MEEARKTRKTKASKLTRTINELLNAVSTRSANIELEEKIKNVKLAMNDVAIVNDEIIGLIPDDDKDTLEQQNRWYNDYDNRALMAIREARNLLEDKPDNRMSHIKLAKLEIPNFSGDYRNYMKWKSQFQRYTKQCDEEVKYDYLYRHSKGNAHKIVNGSQTYADAIAKLDKEFGDVNYTLKLLVDDIRAVNVVRRGDHLSFI